MISYHASVETAQNGHSFLSMQTIRILTDVHSAVESPPALKIETCGLKISNVWSWNYTFSKFWSEKNQSSKQNFGRAFARSSVTRVPPHVPLQQIDPTFKQLSLLQAISKLMTSTNHYIYIQFKKNHFILHPFSFVIIYNPEP